MESSQLNQHQDDKIELLNIDTTREAGPSQLKMNAEDSNLHNGTKYRNLIESQDSSDDMVTVNGKQGNRRTVDTQLLHKVDDDQVN